MISSLTEQARRGNLLADPQLALRITAEAATPTHVGNAEGSRMSKACKGSLMP